MQWETLKYAALSEAERKKADAYAGPGESFPLYKNGEHLKAAWDLSGMGGHDKAAIRSKIKAFAREHNLMHLLPEDAQDEADMVKKAIVVAMLAKARNEDIAQLLQMAYRHESMEGDKAQQANLAHFAKQHGLAHLLPSEAHTVMHEEGIVHEHDGITNDAYGHHEHPMQQEFVRKSFTSSVLIAKAWGDDTVCYVEGWISTPDMDLDRDIVQPEAFSDALDGYASAGMPVSSEHDMKSLPKGHAQRIALVRDGQIFKAATHPTDSAEFQHFPGEGTGVYGRVAITEPDTAGAIRKGNVRSFSWVGKPAEIQPLPNGGRDIKRVLPWVETTVAAYPVNTGARMVAAH